MTKQYHVNAKKSIKKIEVFLSVLYTYNMIYQDIQQELIKKKDIKYQNFMLKSIPNEDHLIGVRMNILKQMANFLIQSERWQEYISYIPFYHEEKMIQALIIAKQVKSFDDVRLIKNFIPQITNWAVCDCFCTYLKGIKNNQLAFFPFVQAYLNSTREFEVRFGLVLLLTYYMDETHLCFIFQTLDRFSHKGYYAKMAAAWLLSLCYVKFKNETNNYLLRSKLDSETFNKGIQKMIESNYVSKEAYAFFRGLKRH
ncbi:MAG: DNA alkylation repair protein [Alphaproteobacteria bacterium]|nr:DNA alkylation repair protein [Alphaproteobacteria bacterium]